MNNIINPDSPAYAFVDLKKRYPFKLPINMVDTRKDTKPNNFQQRKEQRQKFFNKNKPVVPDQPANQVSPAVSNPISKNSPVGKRNNRKFFSTQGLSNEFFRILRIILNDNLCLLFVVFSVTIIFSHYSAVKDGFLHSFLSPYSNSSVFVKWIYKEEKKFLGGIAFVPVCYKLPDDKRMLVSAVVFAWIFLFNSLPVFEYVFAAGMLFFYFKTNMAHFKVFLMMLFAASVFFGYMTLGRVVKSVSR